MLCIQKPLNQTIELVLMFPTQPEWRAWSGSNAPQVSMQASRTQHVNYSPPSHLKRSVSLDRTPTDDEINYLWDRVRVCLNNKSTQSAGSDSCVNKIDVRGSRTASGPVMPGYQHTAPYGYVKGVNECHTHCRF